ncbi:hypothetical protein EYC84_010141 [Monilinia fructicola]|uniref:Uncharacterized protein n=1 Tax=Monilinia fructicola TaxID=38448 RepID=A0A5M9JH68_MONFR|nr:hypothetical protein EYC84_010141 [Monilinia fructicola]
MAATFPIFIASVIILFYNTTITIITATTITITTTTTTTTTITTTSTTTTITTTTITITTTTAIITTAATIITTTPTTITTTIITTTTTLTTTLLRHKASLRISALSVTAPLLSSITDCNPTSIPGYPSTSLIRFSFDPCGHSYLEKQIYLLIPVFIFGKSSLVVLV